MQTQSLFITVHQLLSYKGKDTPHKQQPMCGKQAMRKPWTTTRHRNVHKGSLEKTSNPRQPTKLPVTPAPA
jgi:hypothetical protein